MVLEDIGDEVLGEVAEGIDGSSSDFGCLVVETFGNEDVHDRVLKILFDFLCAAFTCSAKDKKTCVHFVDIFGVYECH